MQRAENRSSYPREKFTRPISCVISTYGTLNQAHFGAFSPSFELFGNFSTTLETGLSSFFSLGLEFLKKPFKKPSELEIYFGGNMKIGTKIWLREFLSFQGKILWFN